MKKVVSAGILFSLLSIPLALADFGQTLQNIFNKVLFIGGFGFLNLKPDSTFLLLLRFMIFILIFTILFATITTLGGGTNDIPPFSYFTRAQAGILSAAIAIIATIFLPAQVLLATGTGWATAVALLFIGGPIVGIAVLCWKLPVEGDTKWSVALKIVLCVLLLWILSAMSYHVSNIKVI